MSATSGLVPATTAHASDATTKPNSKLFLEILVSGVSVGTATTATNPIDVIKTRLQTAQSAPGAQREGMVRTGMNVVKNEGVLALWRGLPPALARGLLYGGLRLGLYSPIKDLMVPGQASSSNSSGSFGTKLAAGSLSGGLAAMLMSPTELVKTRLQAKGNPHKSTMAVVKHVVATDGVVGLWKGAVPGMARAALLTASQCATYDEVKRWVMRTSGWSDGAGTQFACSMVTGLVTTTATNPADVVKTVMYVSGSRYSGPVAAAADIFKREGLKGFAKGWLANYSRLGPQTTITFLVAEKLRALSGLSSL